MKTPLTFAFVFAFILPLYAKDAPGTKDDPLLKRIADSEIIWAKVAKFDEYVIPLAKIEYNYSTEKFKEIPTTKAEGERKIWYYKLPGETSTLEAVKQYEADLKPAGFQTLFTAANDALDDGYNRFVSQTFPTAMKTPGLQAMHEFNHDETRFMALKGKSKDDADIYVTLFAFGLKDVSVGFDEFKTAHNLDKGQTILRVDLLTTKAMVARMTVVKAEEITQTIDQTGRIAIYGVLFDTDKADLKPESADSLAEMAKAITNSTSGKKFLIVGHTDNVGDYAHNQALSQKRAAAVTTALSSKYGVSADRLIPVGVGMAAPVAPNTDDAGRSKNRRVEIVAM